MPRTKISEFSATPASNTDIYSIFIGEGMAPSNVNDAIRELMAQLKDFQVGSAGDPVTVGGVLTVQAGAVGTPAITTAGDTNTGIFFPAADTIAFAEGGVEAARFDSSGNLGLGVTPSAWGSGQKALQTNYGSFSSGSGLGTAVASGAYWNGTNWIYTINSSAMQYLQESGGHKWFIASSGTAGNTVTFTQAMTLDASGNLLVGTTSATGKITVSTSGNTYGIYSENTNTATTSNYLFWGYASSASRFVVYGNGGIANYQANNVNLSDRREKTNFAPAKSYLDVICAIPVQTFNFIDQAENDVGLTLGVIAQDVQAVAPELVTENNWGTEEEPKMRLSIYQTDLQYALMKALQELKAEFDAYKASHP
jgi:hypothetical protein